MTFTTEVFRVHSLSTHYSLRVVSLSFVSAINAVMKHHVRRWSAAERAPSAAV